MIKLKQLLTEKTVRLSTMKDANFVPGEFVQIVGKKGMIKLDKKSVKYLAKWIRSNSGKHGMGWSFTEGKLTEKKYDTIMKGDKVKVIGKYIDSKYRGKKGKVIDMGINGNNYMIKIGSTKMILFPDDIVKEGKLNEGKTLTLPNGVKAIIDFKGIKFKASKGAPVFFDRDELLKFFKGSTKYLRYT